MRRSLAAIVIACILALAFGADAAATQGKTFKGKRELICKGATIPVGWILVDDSRDAGMCGGPAPAIVNAYNVWVIEYIADAPAGSTIRICANQQTPAGWTLVDLYRDKTLCGHPEDLYAVNVKLIRRGR